jgi:uncharacterized protein YbjT (DUF2867 family)
MILLTGAGGKTGKMLIKTLAKVESVCAFVHREEHVSVAKSLGAEKVLVGDMRDEIAIHSAMQGSRAVYHICPNMNPDEAVIGKLVIEAARQSGVEHFVYHSVLHPQTEKMNHHWQKLQVEEILFESGLPFTVLQPAPYMQNLLAGWQSIIENGVLRVPYSITSKFSFVHLDDVREAVKIVLTEPDHLNAIYEIAGTPPLSHVEVAEIFGRVLNRDIQAEREQIRDWRQRTSTALEMNTRSSPREEYATENLIRMFEYYDQWGLVGNPNVLRWILNREPTSLESFVETTWKEHNAIR